MKPRNERKIGRGGVATEIVKRVRVRSERQLGWAIAPCGGFLALYEEPSAREPDRYRRPSIPWDESWEPGTVVDVRIVVTLVRAAPKSRKKCHNPWPAHVHDDERERQRRRQQRRERRRERGREQERRPRLPKRA